MNSNDIGGSNTFTHNHNYLMETITFKVHHITPISPKNTLATILESILIFFFLPYMFFAYFSFKYKKAYHAWAYKRKKKNPFMLAKHLVLAMQFLNLTEHGFYEMHIDVLWLTSFSSEMVIYVFFLGFFSHSRQKEWYEY